MMVERKRETGSKIAASLKSWPGNDITSAFISLVRTSHMAFLARDARKCGLCGYNSIPCIIRIGSGDQLCQNSPLQ